MAIRDQVQHVAGGPPALVPGIAYAVRMVPISGLAAYPRTAQINGRTITVTGPDWWAVGVPPGAAPLPVLVTPIDWNSQFAADVAASSGQGFHGFQGQDPIVENWLVEWCDRAEAMASPAPYYKGWRTLWDSPQRGWNTGGKGDCSPVFDLRAFREVMLTAESNGAGFNITTYWPPTTPGYVQLVDYAGVITGPSSFSAPRRIRFLDRAGPGNNGSGAEVTPVSMGGGLLMLQVSTLAANVGHLLLEGRLS